MAIHLPPERNLSTFSTLFLIKGILLLCASPITLLYVFIGGFFGAVIDRDQVGTEIPFNPAYIFVVVGIMGFILVTSMGIISLLASRYIKQRRNYKFIFIASVLSCLTGLLGILLGVFALVEFNKPEVKELFEPNAPIQ